MFRRWLILLLLVTWTIAPSSVVAGEIVHVHGTTMGPIVWNVKADALPQGLEADGLTSAVQRRLDAVNEMMSTWQEDSEVSRFNRANGETWIDASPELVEVVGHSVEIGRESEGAFDVTVAPLVRLWSFGPGNVPERIPADTEIERWRPHVGVDVVRVRSEPPALWKHSTEATIDLSGIAKGYAVDEVGRELERLGIDGYLVEVGGELLVRGRKPDGEPWRVGIERPVDGLDRIVHRALVIGDRALATSGDYHNYFETDGVRYSHTIDPSTGRPITHRLASVSVVAEDCMTADAWATALMVLGPERGYDLAVERGLAAFFLTRNEAGDGFVERATPAFDRITASPADSPASVSPVTTALIAFGVFLAAISAMAVGVILSNRRIEGSCGGLANLKDRDGRSICEACTNPLPTCGGVEEGREREVEVAGDAEVRS